MSGWTNEELERIAGTDELDISWLRGDGSLGGPRTIWVVQVDDDLYVRSVHGREGIWFRGTQRRHEGHVSVGGVEKDVTFEDAGADAELAGRIDDAYNAKYRARYPPSYTDDTLTPQAKGATLKLAPRERSPRHE